MNKKSCTHEYLAASATGKVLMCRECGAVHLHLQNLSLRFDVDQFSAFAELMSEASKRIGVEPDKSSRKPPTLTLVH